MINELTVSIYEASKTYMDVKQDPQNPNEWQYWKQ